MLASAFSTFNYGNHSDYGNRVLPSDTEQKLVLLHNNGPAVCRCLSASHILNTVYQQLAYTVLSFLLIFHLFALTHTRLIRPHLLCLAVPENKSHGASVLLSIYAEHPRPHFLLKEIEWLQQSVSVENLHGNKSYNLFLVCTLDWLRAITLTKKAFFVPFSSSSSLPATILSASCQINPLNFPKDMCLFPFSPSQCSSISSPPIFSQIWHQERRLLSK